MANDRYVGVASKKTSTSRTSGVITNDRWTGIIARVGTFLRSVTGVVASDRWTGALTRVGTFLRSVVGVVANDRWSGSVAGIKLFVRSILGVIANDRWTGTITKLTALHWLRTWGQGLVMTGGVTKLTSTNRTSGVITNDLWVGAVTKLTSTARTVGTIASDRWNGVITRAVTYTRVIAGSIDGFSGVVSKLTNKTVTGVLDVWAGVITRTGQFHRTVTGVLFGDRWGGALNRPLRLITLVGSLTLGPGTVTASHLAVALRYVAGILSSIVRVVPVVLGVPPTVRVVVNETNEKPTMLAAPTALMKTIAPTHSLPSVVAPVAAPGVPRVMPTPQTDVRVGLSEPITRPVIVSSPRTLTIAAPPSTPADVPVEVVPNTPSKVAGLDPDTKE